jgi:hypothetical protein
MYFILFHVCRSAGNHVSTWATIRKLGQAFPRLESLVLADCPVKSLNPARTVEEHHSQSQIQSGTSGKKLLMLRLTFNLQLIKIISKNFRIQRIFRSSH